MVGGECAPLLDARGVLAIQDVQPALSIDCLRFLVQNPFESVRVSALRCSVLEVDCTHPYFEMSNTVILEEASLIGPCIVKFAIAWFWLLSYVAPTSVLCAELRSRT